MSGVFRRPHLPTFQRSRRRRLVYRSYLPDITTGVEFDGTADYLIQSPAALGAVDSKVGVLSFWVKTATSSAIAVLVAETTRINVLVQADGTVKLDGYDTSPTLVLRIVSATAVNDDAWHHVFFSWNLAATTGQVYIDGSLDASASTATDAAIDCTPNIWRVGAYAGGTNRFDGCLAELYWAQEYEAAPTDWRDGLSPADLGADGSTPTGNQPILYLSGGASQFATNFGSGGPFAITGALVDCPIVLTETITATLSIGAAIQAQRTLATSLSAAIQQQRTATASVDAAVAQALSALTSASAAISATNTATFSLDAALQAAQAATADVDAVIQAVQTAAVSLQGAVQTERTNSVQVGAAVQALIDAQASLDAVIEAMITATTGLSASISEPGVNLATAALSGAIRALQSASIGLTGAIQGAGSAHAALSAGIAAVQSVTATIDAVIAQIVTATPSVDGAILATMSATASLNARIIALGTFSPSLDRMHTAGQASRVHTQGGLSRTHSVPARTRRH